MKRHISEFVLRGMVGCGFGPLILVAVYLVLQQTAGVETLTVNEACIGIVSLYVLAFLAGGMNVVYQIERLPLMAAITIHGAVLYVGYLVTYLVNDWLEPGRPAILVFSAIFAAGYVSVWAVIYTVTKRNTDKVNALLKDRQKIE